MLPSHRSADCTIATSVAQPELLAVSEPTQPFRSGRSSTSAICLARWARRCEPLQRPRSQQRLTLRSNPRESSGARFVGKRIPWSVRLLSRDNPLARRQKLSWADLADQPWVLTDWNYRLVEEAFNAHGLKPPPPQMKTLSVHLRAHMAATRNCITTIPRSVLLLCEYLRLKTLPIELPSRSWPIMAVTVRDRMLSPIVERFLDDARAVSGSLTSASRRSSNAGR